ncbi:ABC-three component system middle component 2 [Micromonospora endolithica]|uniref:ABC-three component system middle component 2 n=1 Tax=Micromonospora endolithica TaxID=230091 RepID=UPI001EE0A17C|nr:ABC-three component system middle component 2 [Micromonospora endolithica]
MPEHDTVFRLAQLVLLLDAAAQFHPDGVPLERLGVYDFIAANPLLMASAEDDPDRLELLMAGFDDRALSYASPAQRFATRRERLQHDLALLLAYDLATTAVRGHVLYRLTSAGHELTSRFTAMYAHSYTLAANIVMNRLRKVSDSRLRECITDWTRLPISPTGIDLADLFTEPTGQEADDDTVGSSATGPTS